jgi:hypothetical protein
VMRVIDDWKTMRNRKLAVHSSDITIVFNLVYSYVILI